MTTKHVDLHRQGKAYILQEKSAIGDRNRNVRGYETINRIELVLSPRRFTAIWALLGLLHGAFCIYLISIARLYWYMEHPYLSYFANLLALPENRYFRLIGTAFGCVGAVHCLKFLSLLQTLLRYSVAITSESSRLMFNPIAQLRRHLDALVGILTGQRLVQKAQRVWGKIFGRQGILGVESEHFQMIFRCQELVSVAAQIYQAHRFSLFISRAWINHFYVAVIVANCWMTPLFQFMFQHTPGLERVACLTMDIILNMSTSVVLPLIIFLPYLEQYIPDQFSFKLELLYDDGGFVNFVMENQSIFAQSLVDCFAKLVPHVSIFLSLGAIEMLIRPERSKASPTKIKQHTVLSASVRPEPELVSEQSPTEPLESTNDAQQQPQKTPLHRMGNSYRVMIEKFYRIKDIGFHLMFLICGLVVLSLHLRAARRLSNSILDCKQYVQPWFATQYPCTMFEFNCYRNGTSSPGEEALDSLDRDALYGLIFIHCPALVMPKSIRNFPNLLGIDIYNSTLVAWEEEAAISADIHKKMVYVILARVNMTSIPEGLLQPFPGMLSDIELSITNLTTLPADLHFKWPSMSVLYLEYSQITEFPPTLLEMTIDDLSLIGNKLDKVPELSATRASYYTLALSHNPLENLPMTLDGEMTLGFLSLESTSLTEIPDWVFHNVDEITYLHASPVCEDVYVPHAVATACQARDPRGAGRYPLAFVEESRTL